MPKCRWSVLSVSDTEIWLFARFNIYIYLHVFVEKIYVYTYKDLSKIGMSEMMCSPQPETDKIPID